MSKIYLSLRNPSPFIMGDEYLYTLYARDILYDPPINILSDNYHYPPLYPIILTPVILFYPNMEIVYRIILIINCILTTSIIFISYLILRKWVSDEYSLFGSLLIALLPITNLYSFTIMSENLYIPLYLFSGLLLFKTINNDTNSFALNFLAGLTIFSLVLVRSIGVFAIIAFYITIFYVIYTNKVFFSKFMINKMLLIVTPIAMFYIWHTMKNFYEFGFSDYDVNDYIGTVLYSILHKNAFILLLDLITNELGYMILATYIVFGGLFLLIFARWRELEPNLKIYMLYSSLYAIFSLITTVSHMMNSIQEGNQAFYYFVWGRYIDPALLPIVIIGIISLYYLNLKKTFDPSLFNYRNLTILSIGLLFFVIFMFPTNIVYKGINVIAIYYIQFIGNNPLVLYLIFSVFLIPLLFFRNKARLFFLFYIFLSILFSVPPYEFIYNASNYAETVNDVGRFLAQEGKSNQIVVMDKNEFSDPYEFEHSLIKFWAMPLEFIYLSDLTNIPENSSYIITKSKLPHNISMISKEGYIVYKIF